MDKPSYGDNDPIAAPATPLAESALALIRTSGGGTDVNRKSVIELLAGIFSRPEKLLSAPGNSIVHGWIIDSENKIDEVLVSVYRAPHSYTGEDAADISCHGGIATVKAVMAALKKADFRDALPGEFTFRAFMNGKLDLTRAESVMELVSAKTDRGREQAVRRLAGVLRKEVSGVKDLLVEVLAGTEIYLDYSEDEFFPSAEGEASGDEEAGRLPGRNLAEQAALRLKALSDLWRRERIYAEGALAVIAGRPNAGKSSLFNYLLKEDRSIVTDIPGTTRDWIEALISIDGIPLRLADTAGLREIGLKEPDSSKADEAERIGIERSMELLDKADLVLYVIDGGEGITVSDREFLLRQREAAPAKPILVLWNKADLVSPPSLREGELPGRLLALSAKTGEGIQELTRSIAAALQAASAGNCPPETSPVISPRAFTASRKRGAIISRDSPLSARDNASSTEERAVSISSFCLKVPGPAAF
jgi:tRNA modification GTPase